MALYAPRYYPAATAALGAFGVIAQAVRTRAAPAPFVAGLLPLFAIVSFTVAFNLVALRSEVRFLLPQSVFFAVYVGIAVDRLLAAPGGLARRFAQMLIAAVAVLAFYQCAGIDAAFIGDPRYDAEHWLDAHVRPGESIEAYGLNVYLPRFPKGAIVTRLDAKPLAKRNPLPNVREVEQPFEAVAARNPRYIVVSAFWVRDYLRTDITAPEDGRAIQRTQRNVFESVGARNYFRDLFASKLPYRLIHSATYTPGFWPTIDTYESLAQTIYLFERIPATPAP
jgi:hypothetical protein